MRTRYNFTAAEGTHFGVVLPLAEQVAAIGNRFDFWDAAAANVTEVSGRVSAWNGASSRQLVQATDTRRPYLETGGLRMHNAATLAPEYRLELSGTQIGSRTALTIAAKFRLLSSALTTDLHYIFGDQSVNTRLMYRYLPSGVGKVLRFDVASNAVDVSVPESNTGQMGVVVEVSGTLLRLTTSWGGQSEITLPASGINLPSLFVGNSSTSGGGDLPGWFQRFGAWTGPVTASQRSALLSWVS